MKLVIGTLNVNGARSRSSPTSPRCLPSRDSAKISARSKSSTSSTSPPLKLENIGTADGNQNGAAIKEVVSLLITQLAAKAVAVRPVTARTPPGSQPERQ